MTILKDGPVPQVCLPIALTDFDSLSLARPHLIYECQEAASSSLAPTIGATSLAPVPTGGPVWQDQIQSWNRFAVKLSGSTNNRFEAKGILPNGSTCVMLYASVMSSSLNANAGMFSIHGVAVDLLSGSSGHLQIRIGSQTARLTASHTDGAAHPMMLVRNSTNGSSSLFTDLGHVSLAGVGATDEFRLGTGIGVQTPDFRFNYVVAWTGSFAEQTRPLAKTTLEHLSWSVGWS